MALCGEGEGTIQDGHADLSVQHHMGISGRHGEYVTIFLSQCLEGGVHLLVSLHL